MSIYAKSQDLRKIARGLEIKAIELRQFADEMDKNITESFDSKGRDPRFFIPDGVHLSDAGKMMVIKLLDEGKSNSEIARIMQVSSSTVMKYRKRKRD